MKRKRGTAQFCRFDKASERRTAAIRYAFRVLNYALFALFLGGCSTKKNTPSTRFYHSMTAHYNTLYNGQVAYLSGVEAQEKAHREDYTTMLPMYLPMNKYSQKAGAGNYDQAIEKCEKAIKVHSIKKRPKSNANKRMSPKEKAYMARKEFNPYLYKAWFLMAESQFNKGDFIEAASTYNYIQRLYATQPEITSIARARMARCYVALQWPYDAEDVLNKLQHDTIPYKGQKEYNKVKAAYLIETKQYEEAIPYLQKAIKATKGKQAKARLNFLLGQVYNETGNNQMAYKAWGKVIRSNPEYEMAFNARIRQTEVMSANRYKQMISRLKRMARSKKNKPYLDQVYYAIGNIYLSVEDTAHCIGAWEKGAKEGAATGTSKAALLLRLSQLYWDMEKYIDATRTYKDCAGMLDKEHPEYKETERRNTILTELGPHLTEIKLQDSLQALARMDSAGYLAAIDRVIDALKKQEKEEAKRLAEQGGTAGGAQTGGATAASNANRTNQTAGNLTGDKGAWYFYSPTTVANGKREFQKKWGQRENEDNWRYSNKSSIPKEKGENAEGDNAGPDGTDESKQSGEQGGGAETSDEEALRDSLENDPHQREFYLKQIPFTEEQMQASNQLLSDGLYHAGILEQERLENFPLAQETMLRLMASFPEHADMDNIYYHLFLINGRLGQEGECQKYRDLLKTEYPKSRYTSIINNPRFEQIARNGTHFEDSVYVETYNAYQQSDYATVGKNYKWSTDNFPEGKNRARLMFVHAMSLLYTGQRDSFMVVLKEVVQKYPKEEITEMAQTIMKGVEDGKPLLSGKFDTSSIWEMRMRKDSESADTIPILTEDRQTNFAFVLAYPTGSLNEDQLLFEIARYNFTNYMVRNFDLETTEHQGITTMIIKGFLSYDEVHSYAQSLYSDERMSVLLKGIRTLLISEDNLKKVGTEFSFDEYKEFYDEKLAPLEVPEDLIIDEPTDLEVIDPDDVTEEDEEEEEEVEEMEDEDDFPYGF